MLLYLEVAIHLCLVLITEGEATVHLTRGLQDKFTNSQCSDNTKCLSDHCADHFATCETESNCNVCVCDKQWPTFVASEKRCVKNYEIFNPTVPKYSSFAITQPDEDNYMCIAAGSQPGHLDDQYHYRGSADQLWLYTTSKKLLNLKTLQCLDSQNHFGVALRPCKLASTPIQTWYCNRSSNGLYSIYGSKDVSYLEFSGSHFYMGSDEQSHQWVPYKLDTGLAWRSICDVPVSYQGCYRFKDGSSVVRFPESQPRDCEGKSQYECIENKKISAPIFSDGNSTCKLVWDESTFSINDQTWVSVSGYLNHFYLFGNARESREIMLQMHEQAKSLWAGALLKLEIECHDNSKFTKERHCVLLKFDGKPKKELQIRPTLQPVARKSVYDYKRSTIGLSIVLGLVLLVMVVVAVILCRRRSTRAWTTTKDDDIMTRPFCDTEPEENL